MRANGRRKGCCWEVYTFWKETTCQSLITPWMDVAVLSRPLLLNNTSEYKLHSKQSVFSLTGRQHGVLRLTSLFLRPHFLTGKGRRSQNLACGIVEASRAWYPKAFSMLSLQILTLCLLYSRRQGVLQSKAGFVRCWGPNPRLHVNYILSPSKLFSYAPSYCFYPKDYMLPGLGFSKLESLWYTLSRNFMSLR